MKTNKSYTKRLRVTKNGKIIARMPGQNHFNSRVSRASAMAKRRKQTINIGAKDMARFLPNH
ncbi:MAG: 50S ribosomal protein L35 [Minisyncoccia bacterium]